MTDKDIHQINIAELYQPLLSRLNNLRTIISQIISDPQFNSQQTHRVCLDCINITPEIKKYISTFPSSVQLGSKVKEKEISSESAVSTQSNRSSISLYVWQLFNFVCINTDCLPKQLAQLVLPLLHTQIQFQNEHALSSLKNAFIFVHNWLTKILKEGQHSSYRTIVLKAVSLLLQNHFEKDTNKKSDKVDFSQTTKTEPQKLAQLEWLSYIFAKMFSRQGHLSREGSLIKEVIEIGETKKGVYYWLHMVGNFLQNMIDARVTTELVAGFESPLKDIKEMYHNSNKNVTVVTLSVCDLQFIVEELRKRTVQFKTIVRDYLLNRVREKEDSVDFCQKWSDNADITTEIGHMLNCVLFLGGYNKKLQDVVSELLLQRDPFLFEYFQLSYLLYRNIESTRYKSKVHVITEMQLQAKNKLFKAVALEPPLLNIDIREMELEKVLTPGQLVFLLRLFTNLVHINHRAQVPFEKQPKYLHMVMSLTHDSVSQATMKEWAIMFIRNVSEWSEKLREEIGKIKLEMKVE